MERKGKTRGVTSIEVSRDTHDQLAREKGPGKTWDRFLRERTGLPLSEVPA